MGYAYGVTHSISLRLITKIQIYPIALVTKFHDERRNRMTRNNLPEAHFSKDRTLNKMPKIWNLLRFKKKFLQLNSS